MKKKIVPFVIGVLVGAIVATSAFLIYNAVTGSGNNGGMPDDRNFYFRGERPEMPDGEMPELPDGEDFNGERPELPEGMKERFNKRGSNSDNKQEQ
jgi:hypothetical protein